MFIFSSFSFGLRPVRSLESDDDRANYYNCDDDASDAYDTDDADDDAADADDDANEAHE